MKTSLAIIGLSAIAFIFIIVIIGEYKKKYLLDTFISINNDPANDGKMTFNYLTNKNYGKNILNKYYQNDDTRINGVRAVYHPYQIKNNKLFGIAEYIRLDKEKSNKLFNDYGVRL